MPAAPPHHRLDRFLAALARLAVRVFFRRVEIVGEAHRTASGPLLVVANHVNGLVDALFLFGTLELPVRFLGKSTLWKIPILAQLLDLAGVIPVYRRQDEGVDPARNRETFARCHEVLARGGMVGLFPEGVSHDEPRLQPLRTGAARIALETELRRGPVGVRILPVGLVFEAKTRFRSRVLVVVGEPLDPAPELAAARVDEIAAARALTARIDSALRRVTLNFASWEEAKLIERAADLVDRTVLDLPWARPLTEEFHLQQALVEGREAAVRRFPEKVEAVASAMRHYDRLLDAAGLRDENVISRYPPYAVARFLARAFVRLALRLPAALVGLALNLVPLAIVRLIARPYESDPDQAATYQIYPSLVVYPAAWVGEAIAVGRLAGGWLSALATVALAPVAGWVAIHFFEQEGSLLRETRAFLVLRTRRRLANELRERRLALQREVEELARSVARA